MGLFRTKTDDRIAKLLLVIFTATGLLASFVLSIDKVRLLENADTKLSCSVNLVVNCASVMKTSQAAVFGVTNSFLGIAGFAAAIALAIVLLAGGKLPRWIMNGLQVGFGLGWVFALWLFYESVFIIQILCPWCLVVTTSTTILFFAMLRLNLQANNFDLKAKTDKSVKKMIEQKYDVMLAIAVVVLLAAIIFIKYGNALFA